jgi:dihydroxy-acid dehydratase
MENEIPAATAERRSSHWFSAPGRSGMIYRAWLRAEGFGRDAFRSKPVIGIASTWSELIPCNSHLGRVAEAVKRGVWQAGGFPLEFPVMGTGESLIRPTAMLYRNLMAMEAEELIRANPLDGVVLLSGCDKTTPALLMAATSADVPAILVTGGPMLNGQYRGNKIGSGTDIWRFEAELRAGNASISDLETFEESMCRSVGHCMTMGTASTMACLGEALGVSLPGSAAWPAVDARRYQTAEAAGVRIVEMVMEGLRPSAILTRAAFENAVIANAAIGGSTNAVIHLLAIAGRAGVDLCLDDFDKLTRDVPTLVDLMPAGRYLMEDFCYAGGMPAVLLELDRAGLLRSHQITVTGKPIGEIIRHVDNYNREVIRSVTRPVKSAGSGIAVLRGNLCPNGAIIKQAAASPELLVHRGKAVVFDSPEQYWDMCDNEDLDICQDDIIVIRNAGPKGYPGMPEVANVPIPAVLIKKGVRDMVRLSDGRMSGTGFGTVVVHISPESATGGPLGLIRSGDWISLDVPNRSLAVELSDAELLRRRRSWKMTVSQAKSGYYSLYQQHVLGADQGADFDFLLGRRGPFVPRDAHGQAD